MFNCCHPLNFSALPYVIGEKPAMETLTLSFVWYLIISEMCPFCYPSETISHFTEVSGISLVQINSETCVVTLK